MALGLVSSEVLDDYWSRNTRRRVAYDFPQGTAPLTALLSLMDSEETPIQEFGWNEERFTTIKTKTSTTGQPTADITFYTAGGTVSAGTPVTMTAGLSFRAYVDDASNFQIDDTIGFFNMTFTVGSGNIVGRVTGVNTTNADWVEFEVVATPPSTVVNSATSEGKYVYLLGSAFAEGARSRTGRNKFPIELKNYTQIRKNAFELTRNALKQPLIYDKSGHYEKALKDNGIDHLAGLEYTAFFGKRRKTTATDPDTGETVKRYFSGGLLWFLEQWELGTSGELLYPHDDVSTQTDWQTYTNKRIIRLNGGTLSRSQFNDLNSRVFEKCNNSTWDKLCLCGQGYLNRVTEMFEKQVTWTSLRENGFKGFDFQMVEHSSNSGKVYYKTHPLFNDEIFRNSAFYIDLGFLKWRYITDSDTDVVQGIQYNDADKRKDQYLTDGGHEIWFPEAHMFVDNLGGITV